MPVKDYEFDQFRLSPELCELTRAGRPVRLEKIPFDVLVFLVEHRGELVSREAITAALWGSGGFQDFDQSLNTAIRKVRMALRDSTDEPRFIQTVVGRGYRFLPEVTVRERPLALEPPRVLAALKRDGWTETRRSARRAPCPTCRFSGPTDGRMARLARAA